MQTYSRSPVRFVRGEGAWLYTSDGARVLDAISGIGVTSLGHAHPELNAVLAEQAARIWLPGNGAIVDLQDQLAARLCALASMDGAFFCNSGAEATECAIKLARLHGHQRGLAEPLIVVASGAFHGRTLGCMAATDNPKITAGFGPLPAGFKRVDFGNVAALEQAVDDPQVVAVLLETIQGEGGVQLPPPGYLAALRELTAARGQLWLADEVQCGIAKTGAWFAYQHAGLIPDVVPVAKALANGLPVGACLARGVAATLFKPGQHGSTFGGGALACAVALAVLEIIERDQLRARAAVVGERIVSALRERLAGVRGVREIRGQGLMIGIELDRPAAALKAQCLDAGLWINITRDHVVRLLPPLILSDEQAQLLIETLTTQLIAFVRA